MNTITTAKPTEELRKMLAEIEDKVVNNYTLADAIREGSTVTSKATNWGHDGQACAMTAGVIAATARGYVG